MLGTICANNNMKNDGHRQASMLRKNDGGETSQINTPILILICLWLLIWGSHLIFSSTFLKKSAMYMERKANI